jgi:putative endonuclease
MTSLRRAGDDTCNRRCVDGGCVERFLSAMEERFAVYILASRRNGTLYVGFTGNLPQCIGQHRARAVPGFTQRYGVTRLVHVERFADPVEAIAREKQLKGWNRAWKLKLIERGNPDWDDLPCD